MEDEMSVYKRMIFILFTGIMMIGMLTFSTGRPVKSAVVVIPADSDGKEGTEVATNDPVTPEGILKQGYAFESASAWLHRVFKYDSCFTRISWSRLLRSFLKVLIFDMARFEVTNNRGASTKRTVSIKFCADI